MLSKQSTSKTKDDAASEAMEALTQERERQEEARCVCEQKCDEASVAQTMFNDTFKVTLEKAEALERHVKTVTMRAESLATTDGDFFYTLVNRQEEGQKYLNSLSAQLSTVAPAAHHRKPPEAAQHLRPHHTAESRDVFQVLQQRKGAGGAAVALHVRSRNSAVRLTAQAWNDASNYGPYCELLFFLMKREPDLTERRSTGSRSMASRAGERSRCLLGTRPSDPCRGAGSVFPVHAGAARTETFFAIDLIRGVIHVLEVIVCVLSTKDEWLSAKVVEAHSSPTWLARFLGWRLLVLQG